MGEFERSGMLPGAATAPRSNAIDNFFSPSVNESATAKPGFEASVVAAGKTQGVESLLPSTLAPHTVPERAVQKLTKLSETAEQEIESKRVKLDVPVEEKPVGADFDYSKIKLGTTIARESKAQMNYFQQRDDAVMQGLLAKRRLSF